jgi:hypothetical protein
MRAQFSSPAAHCFLPLFALLPAIGAIACSETGSRIVRINDAPTVTIRRPVPEVDGVAGPFDASIGIEFEADIHDPQDEEDTLSVVWTGLRTDLGGGDVVDLGSSTPDSGGNTTHLVVVPTEGNWTITATVEDSGGLVGSQSLPIIVLGEDLAPEVRIHRPEPFDEFIEGESITFSGSADDDRDTAALSIEWFDDSDGLLDTTAPTQNGQLAFSTDLLSAGDHTVTLTAYDPAGGQSWTSVSFTVVPADLPPTAPSVVIEPANPNTDDDLTCTITIASTDPEGLAVTHAFTWSRGGAATSLTSQTISASETSKGEEWTCEVVGNDGVSDGPVGSDTVTITNSTPSATSVLLDPSPAYEDTTLTCTPSGWFDADGEAEFYEYSWFVDGNLVAAATGDTLTGADFDRDQFVECEATPFDGEDYGLAVLSNSVLIENTAPSASTPGLTPAPLAELIDDLICTVATAATDLDGDNMTDEVRWLVDGSYAPAWDGVWTIPAGTAILGEAWTCEIRATDGTDPGPWSGIVTTILPFPGDLVITEFLADPDVVSDAAGEWIEVYNAATVNIDLIGFEIHDDGSDSHFINTSLILAPGGRAVLTRNAVVGSNGGVLADYEYSGFTLDNSTDEIVLSFAGLEVDRVNYNLAVFTDGQPGHAASLDPDLGVPDATANDVAANWCGSTLPLTTPGSDFGTPGAPNDSCLCWDSDIDNDGFGGDVTVCSVWDCDDNDASINPAAVDVCENGIDEDCDGVDLLCSCLSTDNDGDGYGTGLACNPVDCDDNNSQINPGATEVCDGIDNNCIFGVDEGFETCGGDCNDGNPAISPNAPEVCDGIDNNCIGGIDEGFDNDNDGWTTCAGDCNDGNPGIYPGALDVCDGINQDCDSQLDENAAGDGFEPNNSSSTAFYMAGNNTNVYLYADFQYSTDNDDWFWINTVDDTNFLCDAFNIQVWLQSLPSGVDYDIYLYNSSLTLMDYSINGGNANEHIDWGPGCGSWGDDGGVYYIRVVRYSGWDCSDTYYLQVLNDD